MHVGNVKTVKHGNRECQLRLIEILKIDDGIREVKFSFGCVGK